MGRARSCRSQDVADVVQAEGVGKRGSGEAGAGSVIGVDSLVDDPAEGEELEDAADAGEDGEDDEVNDAFGILAVVHGADAGNEAEQGGKRGVGQIGAG